MRIIVNATPLQNIATGIGRYLKSLYTEICLHYPDIEVKYFDGTDIYDEMPTPPEAKSVLANAVAIAWRLPSFIPYLARRYVYEKSAKRFFELSKGFDIYHEVGYFPFKAAKNVKTMFTIHDLSLKTFPHFHPNERVLYFNHYFTESLRYVDSIITPSEFTKKEIKNAYPHMDAAIYPIHLGFKKSLFYKRPDSEIDLLKIKMKLPDNYILFVGTSDPRKNIQSIITAMAHLPATVKFVCVGWSGWDRTTGKKQICGNMQDRLISTGYLTDQELAVLYSGARVFVYPSFYEGFGLPVLEAMACGCPVVCSDRASLPEVVENAAIQCRPDDIRCLVDSIDQVFTSNSLYAEMSIKSLEQAKKFSWTETAEKTINVFSDTIRH
ncbi:MAG: glycosyltransferase family 1 protein [Desulfosalsimonadaceae bacterium]